MKKPILFVNACVRKESRTRKLAEKLLIKMDQPYEEICLADISFTSVSEEYLNMRDHLISIGDYQNPMFSLAQQFLRSGNDCDCGSILGSVLSCYAEAVFRTD